MSNLDQMCRGSQQIVHQQNLFASLSSKSDKKGREEKLGSSLQIFLHYTQTQMSHYERIHY